MMFPTNLSFSIVWFVVYVCNNLFSLNFKTSELYIISIDWPYLLGMMENTFKMN